MSTRPQRRHSTAGLNQPPRFHRRSYSDPGLGAPYKDSTHSGNTDPIYLCAFSELFRGMDAFERRKGNRLDFYYFGQMLQAVCNLITCVLKSWFLHEDRNPDDLAYYIELKVREMVFDGRIDGSIAADIRHNFAREFMVKVSDGLDRLTMDMNYDYDLIGRNFAAAPKRYTFLFMLFYVRIQEGAKEVLGFEEDWKEQKGYQVVLLPGANVMDEVVLKEVGNKEGEVSRPTEEQKVWWTKELWVTGMRSVMLCPYFIRLLKYEDVPLQAVGRYCFFENDNMEGKECAICLENFSSGSGDDNAANDNHFPIQMQMCKHVFGAKCLEEWLRGGPKTGKITCPLCRAELHEPLEIIFKYRKVQYGVGWAVDRFNEDVEHWLKAPGGGHPYGIVFKVMARFL